MRKDSKQKLFSKAIWLTMVLFCIFSFIFTKYLDVNAAATPPRMISYQGRILNANGVPIANTSIDMIFQFYDSLAGGTCLWSNSASDCATATARSMVLTDGLFSTNLGDTGDSYAAIPTTVFDDASVYLQVTIDGETLSPRKQLVASPYSMNSDMLDGNDSTSFFSVSGDNTVTGVNNFINAVFSGTRPLVFEGNTVDDFETIFAFTDPTLSDRIVTFQNASGTVAFLNDIGWVDGGTTVYATTATDSVAVGGSNVSASTFGVTPSTGIIYMGSGSINPVLTFKDATSGSGTITYNNDHWEFTGGDIIHNSSVTYASAPGDSYGLSTTSIVSSAASGGAGTYGVYQLYAQANNTSVESFGYDQTIHALGGSAINSGIGVMNQAVGVSAFAINSSTAASPIELAIYGVYSEAYNIGAGSTVPTAVAVYGKALSHAGTITNAYGVQGLVHTSTGTVTNAYAGDFDATYAGANRYGIRAGASGGTKNYAGYFYGSAVQIDSTTSPSAPTYANGAGDLYVYDQIEIDGTGELGGFIASIVNDSLTTGAALNISRENSGTDYINTSAGLVSLSMGDSASTGNTLYTSNSGTGYSLYVNQMGDQQAMYVTAYGTTDYISRFFNDGNVDTNMGLDIQACLDTNPTSACNFIAFKDGNGTILGAIEGNGAGGVIDASAGSDYAELFTGSLSSFSQGDVIGLDALGNAVLASEADKIIGAFSIAPNTLGNWSDGWQESGVYVPVALLGQVPVKVNTESGAIEAGDYLTLSSNPGVAMKATGVGYVLGRALESHTSGDGIINVYVQPKWQAINVLAQDGSVTTANTDLALSPVGVADASNQGFDSYGLMFRGSGWNGLSEEEVSMAIVNDVTSVSEYQLSFKNSSDLEVASINQDGDLAISGKLYPSDRGVLQTDKYIYYDGSLGLGGDFIRTNASGWGSGSYDFAEMFPAQESVAPGEVVIFADNKDSIKRSTGEQYDDRIAGIVSTQPGFLAGQNINGHVPVALAGRVPTYVSGENGSISVGDPLTTSSTPGYAMKATENGQIVGYAMESFSGDTGSISVFVRPSYFDGNKIDLSDNVVTQTESSSTLDLYGVVNVGGGSLLSVGSITGIGDMWSIAEDGTITTRGRFVEQIDSLNGNKVYAYAVSSTQTSIELSGTIELEDGRAHVFFEEIDPDFNDIIDPLSPYRVLITAHGPSGSLYATDRDTEGFIIRDTLGTSDVEVDWLVIAYHKDYGPEPEIVEDNIITESETDPAIVSDQNENIDITVEETVQEQETSTNETDETVVEDVVEVSEDPVAEDQIIDNPQAEEPVEQQVEEVIEPVVVETIE
jgi:hypothetical protein